MSFDKSISNVRAEVAKRFDFKNDAEIDEYRIAYYCSKGNWIDTNTGNPIEVVKWRYLRWDNDEND